MRTIEKISVTVLIITLILQFIDASVTDYNCNIEKATKADFVFLVDTSRSMCTYLESMKNGFNRFVNNLRANGISDSRYSIVSFGGDPLLLLPFNEDVDRFTNVLTDIECNSDGQEASLEAIRRTLLNDLMKRQQGGIRSAANELQFRENVTLNLILVTDEDSDLPIDPRYFVGEQYKEVFQGQDLVEPGWSGYSTTSVTFNGRDSRVQTYITTRTSTRKGSLETNTITTSTTLKPHNYFVIRTDAAIPTLLPGFQGEVDQTAALILEKDARISIIISANGNPVAGNIRDTWSNKPNVKGSFYDAICKNGRPGMSGNCNNIDQWNTWTGAWQFGSPYGAVENADFSNFSLYDTFVNLQTNGLGNSLQAQVLKDGGLARVFDIERLSDPDVVNNLYSAAVELVNVCASTIKYEQNLITATEYSTVSVTSSFFETEYISTETLKIFEVLTTEAVEQEVLHHTINVYTTIDISATETTSQVVVETLYETALETELLTEVETYVIITEIETSSETSTLKEFKTHTKINIIPTVESVISIVDKLEIISSSSINLLSETIINTKTIIENKSETITKPIIETSIIVEYSTVIVTPVPTITNSNDTDDEDVEDEEDNSNSNLGPILGGTGAALAAGAAAAAAFYYYSRSADVIGTSSLNEASGLAGATINPIFTNEGNGLGTNQNPLYESENITTPPST